MKAGTIWGGVLLVWLIGGLWIGGLSYVADVAAPLLVVFGWARFLEDNVPRMTFDLPAVALGCGATLIFVGLAHFVLRSLVARPNESGSSASLHPATRWKWRWTCAILAVVLLMFVAGISLVGLTHQALWLANSPEPLYVEVLGGDYGATNDGSYSNQLKTTGMAFHSYHDSNRGLPEKVNRYGHSRHSWATLIAPYASFDTGEIDLTKPWDDPVNVPQFKKLKWDMLNPNFTTDTWRDADGYGLSHYSANERVLGPGGVSTFDAIADGTSNTLLLGEVDANFEPWGKPGNWRDPAAGLNRSPHGFGCPRGSRLVYFVMADGSVRQLSDNIDPEVLRALATPTGGDSTR